MTGYLPWLGALCGAVLLTSGCSEQTPSGAAVPTFDDPDLQRGRAVWMQVCRNCHLMGVAGAPPISDPLAWQPRVAKGLDALHASAVEGISGESGWLMPPRGGNDTLADEDVRRAVDFMLAAVEKLGT